MTERFSSLGGVEEGFNYQEPERLLDMPMALHTVLAAGGYAVAVVRVHGPNNYSVKTPLNIIDAHEAAEAFSIAFEIASDDAEAEESVVLKAALMGIEPGYFFDRYLRIRE